MAVLKFRVDADGGWCDAQSGESVPEHKIKARYEPTLRVYAKVDLGWIWGGFGVDSSLYIKTYKFLQ